MTTASEAEGPLSPDDGRRFAGAVLEASGMRADDAALVADSLVQAELWGHPSHGLLRLPWYEARLRSGATLATATPKTITDARAIGVIDGCDAQGQVVAAAAMRLAVEKARAHGVGAVSVRRSGHFGAAMYFTREAARAGCVGLLATNSSPAMPPFGGAEKRLGANPWSVAAPAGRHPTLMLDISNTAVARGKLHVAKDRGEAIPPGWAVGPDGAATTDPAVGLAGAILPLGGHKGAGLSIVMDMLCGVLSGGAVGAEVIGPYTPRGSSGATHFALAIDIAAFRPLTDFEADMERMIDLLKATPRATGVEEIFYPGEPEARAEARNLKSGVALPLETKTTLRTLAEAVGVAAPF